MNRDKHWHIVYTKPNMERKVSDVLNKRKIENFLAVNTIRKPVGEKSKLFQVLFPCYLFAMISEQEQESIKSIEGVSGFVYWLDKPLLIKPEEIKMLKGFLKQYFNIKMEKIPLDVNMGASISNNAFLTNGLNVIELDNCIMLSLPFIGYAMVALSERPAAELQTSKKHN